MNALSNISIVQNIMQMSAKLHSDLGNSECSDNSDDVHAINLPVFANKTDSNLKEKYSRPVDNTTGNDQTYNRKEVDEAMGF